MKKVKQVLFILHSLNGSTSDSFKNGVTQTAESLGYEVIYPEFAKRENSSFENFDEVMSKFLIEGKINSNTIFVAHSISANYLIKFLFKHKLTICALVSVGGALILHPNELVQGGYNLRVKTASLPNFNENLYAKSNIQHIFYYYSDNDRHINSNIVNNFLTIFDAEPMFYSGLGHFSKTCNVTNLPDIDKILKKLKD